MKGKFLKSLSSLLLILALSTPNLTYAEGESSDVEESSGIEAEDAGIDSSGAYDVFADQIQEALNQYAVDIFHDRKMIFHYRSASVYDTQTLADTDAKSGLLKTEEEETCAHDYNRQKEGNPLTIPNEEPGGDPVENPDADPDTNPEGAWFGFNGVNNRIAVFNRSNADVDMKVNSSTVDNGLTLNLFLNGDGLEYSARKLNVTDGKALPEGEETVAAAQLYSTSDPIGYTAAMSEFLKYTQAFVPAAQLGNDDGGRFAALAANDPGASPVVQSTEDPVSNPLTNSVRIAAHSVSEEDHMLGYALVYLDVTGKPADALNLPAYPASIADARKIGVVTLTFSSVE